MKRIILSGMILILCLLLAACSNNTNSTESTSDQSSATESATLQNSPSESAGTVNQGAETEVHFSSVEEYVKKVFGEDAGEVFTTDYMTYKVYADQNTLVYDYTYDQQYDTVDDIKKKLDESFEAESETTQYLLSELRRCVDAEDPKIKYIFRNNDGTVITEQIFG